MGSTTALRQILKARFFARVIQQGFVIDSRRQPLSTTFRRRRDDLVQIFEIQWDKYGKPRFVVNFGTCPAAGLEIDGVNHAAGETFASWCADAGRLQPRSGTSSRSWFRQDAPWLDRLRGRPALRAPDEVVDELQRLFPELEAYWTSGALGRHLTQWNRR